jgi:hypothetical protein
VRKRVSLKYFISSLILLLSLNAHSSECRFSPISGSDVTSEKIAKTLESWRAKNPNATSDDIICCLPDDWRSNYVVLPNSHSLQCSGSQFPRVILFDPSHGQIQLPLQSAISFVGPQVGDSICKEKFGGLNNHDGLEILEFNKAEVPKNMFQFVHIDPNHKPTRNVNSFVCLDCHRSSDGLKPFSQDLNSQFSNLGAFAKPEVTCVTAAERGQQKNWNDEFKKLVFDKRQKPYSCLLEANQKTSNPYGANLSSANTEFVRRLALAQNFHIAPRIKAASGFSSFKFAIVAAAIGCTTSGQDFSEYLPSHRLPNSKKSLAGLNQLSCFSADGICGKAIPKECRDLSQNVLDSVEKAAKALPADYGALLAQTIHDQGRNALLDPQKTAQYAQLNFLMNAQPDAAKNGLDQIFEEFPGPRSIDFNHLAQQLINQDGELEELKLKFALPADQKYSCAKLLTAAKKVTLPSSKQSVSPPIEAKKVLN